MKIETRITYFGRDVILRCDGDCEHAWGKHWCGEKGEAAPVDPGTYEGMDAKPTDRRHNRWCARECERSTMIDQYRDEWPQGESDLESRRR